MLFKELYHRVKNNLQIITSLLTLQIDRIKDKKAIFIISEMTQRIKAMSMIHEKLYQTDNLSLVNMQEYTQGLANDLQQGVSPATLHFDIDCEEIELSLVVAVPMGLIINELVTNAIKYAFVNTDKKQIIVIKMYKKNDEDFSLEIYDNGKGIDMSGKYVGFGLNLVNSLVKYQLKGKLETYNDEGLHHKIHFIKGLLK
jgi:two-component sensor histidine kinase